MLLEDELERIAAYGDGGEDAEAAVKVGINLRGFGKELCYALRLLYILDVAEGFVAKRLYDERVVALDGIFSGVFEHHERNLHLVGLSVDEAVGEKESVKITHQPQG